MELLKYPNPILYKKCTEALVLNSEIKLLIKEMSEKLYEWNGIGLAAPQVGISKRIVLIDIREEPSILRILINPTVIWKSEETIESEEGCLSIPLLRKTILRHALITVEYLDETFSKKTIEKADGLLSCCLQHEIDHLDGRLYIDHLSRLGRARAIREFKKLQKETDCKILETNES
jgi:peptide deformylase